MYAQFKNNVSDNKSLLYQYLGIITTPRGRFCWNIKKFSYTV